jgi:hypothetical protein
VLELLMEGGHPGDDGVDAQPLPAVGGTSQLVEQIERGGEHGPHVGSCRVAVERLGIAAERGHEELRRRGGYIGRCDRRRPRRLEHRLDLRQEPVR